MTSVLDDIELFLLDARAVAAANRHRQAVQKYNKLITPNSCMEDVASTHRDLEDILILASRCFHCNERVTTTIGKPWCSRKCGRRYIKFGKSVWGHKQTSRFWYSPLLVNR